MLGAGMADIGAARRSERDGKMGLKLGSTLAAAALCLALLGPARPAAAADPSSKAEIETMLQHLGANTHGLIEWEGADRIEVHWQDEAAITDIAGARLSVGAANKPAAERAQLAFDHIELRRSPAPDGGVAFALVLPRTATLKTATGGTIELTLDKATGHAIVDGKTGRARASDFGFAGARLSNQKTGDWISFGPLSLSSKLGPAAKGGWTAPIDLALQDIKFFFTEGPVSGAVDRIAYNGRSAGPDLAALDRLRDRVDALRRQEGAPSAHLAAASELLPQLAAQFSILNGKLTLSGLTVRAPTGQPVVAFKEAGFAVALTGMSGAAAALRVTLDENGLSVAPKLLAPDKVPQRAVLDFGLEDLATGPLRTIVEGALRMQQTQDADAKRQTAGQLLGAAAMLKPVLRVYDLALDTCDVGIIGQAEAKGSPLAPKGYTASGEIAVRGFGRLANLVGASPLVAYLPLLAELGEQAKAADGTPRTQFHLAFEPPKRLTINGNDVSAWFAPAAAAPGELRDLRPARPALSGADVHAVQSALAAAGIGAPQNGLYDAATAAAVARFQKANGLDVDGVVDAATRKKLGVTPPPPQVNK